MLADYCLIMCTTLFCSICCLGLVTLLMGGCRDGIKSKRMQRRVLNRCACIRGLPFKVKLIIFNITLNLNQIC